MLDAIALPSPKQGVERGRDRIEPPHFLELEVGKVCDSRLSELSGHAKGPDPAFPSGAEPRAVPVTRGQRLRRSRLAPMDFQTINSGKVRATDRGPRQ